MRSGTASSHDSSSSGPSGPTSTWYSRAWRNDNVPQVHSFGGGPSWGYENSGRTWTTVVSVASFNIFGPNSKVRPPVNGMTSARRAGLQYFVSSSAIVAWSMSAGG